MESRLPEAPPESQPTPQAKRAHLFVGLSPSYERRIHLWTVVLAAPCVVSLALLGYLRTGSVVIALVLAAAASLGFAIAGSVFHRQLIRPLQTLANVVAALGEDDFSLRVRGARRGDSMGDLALEINELASTLQSQRIAARDALTLVECVISSMPSPVVAFDAAGHLRLFNPAAERVFQLERKTAVGRPADALRLTRLLETVDQELYAGLEGEGQSPASLRWSVRRSTFRLEGVPHTLLVLSDVAAVLREEERLAWQRLIRVLRHEIANSLTPIKSIAGSLRDLALKLGGDPGRAEDFRRGLEVIEERAASLNRFLQSYQQLTHLPPPAFQRLSLQVLLRQAADLETRLPVRIVPGPETYLPGDPDQLQQLLINLVRNAVEAAFAEEQPEVAVTWSATTTEAVVQIRDNGEGLINALNLFVPFYTTKPHGNGIGLVLAQQIASAHGGSVALFNNSASRGCTAEVRLPVAPRPRPE